MNMRLRRMDTQETSLVDCLNELIEVNLDLIGIYQGVIQQMPLAAWRQKLADFRAEHLEQVRELSQEVRRLYGTPVWPVGEGDPPRLSVLSAEEADGDDVHALMQRVWEGEARAHEAYEWARTLDGVQVHAGIEALVEYNLEEEAHHRVWFRGAMDAI